jgi:aryl-alcohol dehydrogenase-like predicted oxidoreductase
MKYRKLGRTGFEVSEIGHGLWGMSGWSGADDEESRKALRLTAELGCNFFDTAWAYGDGKSDSLLGELLAEKRNGTQAGSGTGATAPASELYAASKIPPLNRKWPASGQDKYTDVFPEAHVLKYAELIREKLGVAAIDVLQFHVWDDAWAGEPEFRRTVERLKGEGKIRAFGLSLNRWEPENGIAALRTGLVDAVQVIYNIFDQAPEDKLFPVCRELNIGVIARVPLDEGSLGGKLTRETKFPANDFRSRYFGPENLTATLERVEKLKAILPARMTLAEMALRFILSNPIVSTTIIGMRNLGHVRENLWMSDAGPLEAGLLAELKKHRWDRGPRPWSA